MPKVAAVQMCSSNILEENLKSAEILIEEAAIHGAELVVLPEMFPIIGKTSEEKLKIKENYGSGKIQNFLSKKAEKNNIWIIGGTIPIHFSNEKIKAACIVYNNKGNVVCRYDKIHLFDANIAFGESYKESETTEAGNKLAVVDTPVGKVGLSVCYDIRFPIMFSHLFDKGAEIITIPSAFTEKTGKAHWHILARSRAIENFCYVIGACQSGTHIGGRKTYGHTLIVDPWGCILSEKLDTNQGVIYAEIDLENLYKIRNSMPIRRSEKIIKNI